MTYERPEGGTVVPMPAPYGGALVASRSTPGSWWHVTSEGQCPCPATVERCWHIRQVAEYVRRLDAQSRARDNLRLGPRPPHPGLVG